MQARKVLYSAHHERRCAPHRDRFMQRPSPRRNRWAEYGPPYGIGYPPPMPIPLLFLLAACRGSGVLRLEGGVDGSTRGAQWKIVQYNLALTVPNERFDEVKKLLALPAPTTRPADERR